MKLANHQVPTAFGLGTSACPTGLSTLFTSALPLALFVISMGGCKGASSDPLLDTRTNQEAKRKPSLRSDEAEKSPVKKAVVKKSCRFDLNCKTKAECQKRGLLDCRKGKCIQCATDADCTFFQSTCNNKSHFCNLQFADDLDVILRHIFGEIDDVTFKKLEQRDPVEQWLEQEKAHCQKRDKTNSAGSVKKPRK